LPPATSTSRDGEGFHARTLTHLGATVRRRPDGTFEDAEGLRLESFELVDNLMIADAVHASGATIVRVPTEPESRWTDLRGFEECLRQAAARRPRP
jgi:hypothetical protein